MRVIAGKAKGIKLVSLAGSTTRPTADRVKEALFNILAPFLPAADFLDLFAGNGGIGIEALSRGAASAVFVDANPGAVQVIKKNLQRTKLTPAQVYKNDFRQGLQRLHSQKQYFDLVFFDPPYRTGLFSETLFALEQLPILKKGGIMIGESGKKEESSLDMLKFCLMDVRSYGDSKLSFYKHKEDTR